MRYVQGNQPIFFHTIFQTIRIHLPLVAGRPQRKRSIYHEVSNIIEISEYTVKKHCGGNQPNVSACTTCRHGLYKSMLYKNTR